jgi:hypothetical protein
MNPVTAIARFSIAIALLFSAFLSAHACICASLTSCEAAGNADAVFIAKAIDEHQAFRALPAGNDETKTVMRPVAVSTLQISEVFFGTDSTTIDLWGNDTNCDYPFELGKTYLVFAQRDHDGRWTARSCSHTGLLESENEDLVYLRNIRKAAGSTLNGSVTRVSYDRALRRTDRGMGNVSVYLDSPTNKYRAMTDARGNFEVRGLAGGRYRVYTEPATNQNTLSDWGGPPRSEWTVKIPDKGCQTVRFSAAPAGSVSGRVWSGTELVTRNLDIELIPVGRPLIDQNGLRQSLGADGSYLFDFLPPGRYYVGIMLSGKASDHSVFPTAFYSGVLSKDTANIVEIGRDQQLSGYDLHLPESLRLRTLEGVVTGPDGKPAANADVLFWSGQTDDQDGGWTTTDGDGKFSFQGIEGQTYELRAISGGDNVANSTPVQIKFGATNVPVRLTFGTPEK